MSFVETGKTKGCAFLFVFVCSSQPVQLIGQNEREISQRCPVFFVYKKEIEPFMFYNGAEFLQPDCFILLLFYVWLKQNSNKSYI